MSRQRLDKPERVCVRPQFQQTHGLDPRAVYAVSYIKDGGGIWAHIQISEQGAIRVSMHALKQEFKEVIRLKTGDVPHEPFLPGQSNPDRSSDVVSVHMRWWP